ncbi:hypothetical protein EOI86_07355 [Hwanghaeella grinnelliae]|uniref:SGNH/GDSL hydrolase family protein n=1 Tax=Hwanghaeella grinnelliae TaxID=2500179 RepID=A0A3S2VSX4_9PROT|nr:hypothetical protein [Hwanghaeella grinnelliae]RVU39065.1 hypothetical protein EOI86_07355 [Hwanghaeella grinnelliae]
MNAAVLAFFASCIVVFFGFVGATEWLIRDQVLPQDTLGAHSRLLNTSQVSDAAFGDSHAARGFNASDGFINLAYPSENIHDMAVKAMSYFSDHAPGRIILQADPHLFAPYRVNSRHKIDNDVPNLHIRSVRHRSRAFAYWETFLRNGGHLESKVTVTDFGSLLSSGDLSAVPPRKRLLDAQIRRTWHTIRETEHVETARREYAALIDWLVEKGARLCLVSYPVSEDYAAAMASATSSAGHEEEIAFFKNQAARVGAHYWDARAAVRNRGFFRDVDHLNSEGATRFSPDLLKACFGD